MRQHVGIWRGEDDWQLWLSMLVDAMEEAARPEIRALPCAPAILQGLHAQLRRPVPRCRYRASAFSLRN